MEPMVEIAAPFSPYVRWGTGLVGEGGVAKLQPNRIGEPDDRRQTTPCRDCREEATAIFFAPLPTESVLQLIMEADVDGLIAAGRYERGDSHQTWRNGYRDRSLDTRLGTLNLKIPKMRQGTYFRSFLEPRKMAEKALVAVIQLVQAMGMTGISKSSVSEICKDIDERVNVSQSALFRAIGLTCGSTPPI